MATDTHPNDNELSPDVVICRGPDHDIDYVGANVRARFGDAYPITREVLDRVYATGCKETLLTGFGRVSVSRVADGVGYFVRWELPPGRSWDPGLAGLWDRPLAPGALLAAERNVRLSRATLADLVDRGVIRRLAS